MFSCEYRGNFKNAFGEKHLRTAASTKSFLAFYDLQWHAIYPNYTEQNTQDILAHIMPLFIFYTSWKDKKKEVLDVF